MTTVKVRQNAGENIQNYAERILSLAEEAYDNQRGDAIERQLIDILFDGLLNDQLKMKLLRDRPNTLQGAVTTCTNEQNLRTRVQLSYQSSNSTHRSMEVDHSRGQFNFKNKFNRVNSAINTQANRPIRCWNCGQGATSVGTVELGNSKVDQPRGHGRPRVQNQQENQMGN